jgi:hypothetical protein
MTEPTGAVPADETDQYGRPLPRCRQCGGLTQAMLVGLRYPHGWRHLATATDEDHAAFPGGAGSSHCPVPASPKETTPVADDPKLLDAVEAFYTALRNYSGHNVSVGRYMSDHGSEGWVDDGVHAVVEALLQGGWTPPSGP